MDIRVSGHQVETGQAFRVLVEERLGAIAEKYFERTIAAHVTLSNGPFNDFVCDIVMHVMQGVVLKGSNRGATAQLAFEGAADRIEKQLRRYMRRLKDKSGLQSISDLPVADFPANAEYRVFQAAPEEVEAPDAPLTIAETKVDIPEASVSDAVMMLDLRNTTALLFRNSGTGAYNMVYRREDGNIGWVEPRT
ncbi:ribosome hibernation-promoting factor, HPF/YfiA family [Sandaracinobacteroides sp. A072]|uniref:ribosome hibernation-promoting factor, HPF/YfiA family n=1 Tax=Sandaracinobacteroides sp. A072 TaxID=3461146 RepID=UPI0040416003